MDEGKDRKRNRNPLGFTVRQLGVILDFYREFAEDPRISFGKFHRKDSPYSRTQSTIDLLNKAYKEYVLIGPYIYCNSGIDVTLLKTNEKSSKLPLGYYGYEHLFITFKTEYEIGLAHALRGLDHSPYIEKYNDTILLTLFVPPGPLSPNRASGRFQDLEEMGIIHDLRVSIPTKWWKPNYDFPK